MPLNTHSMYSHSGTSVVRYLAMDEPNLNMMSIKNLTQFTWEAWVKIKPEWRPEGNNLNRSYVYWEAKANQPNVPNYTNPRFSVSLNSTHVRFGLSVSDDDRVTNYTYPYDFMDKWTHIAFAVDTGEQEYDILINGVLVQTGALVGGGIDMNDDPLPITDSTPSLISIRRGWVPNVSPQDHIWNGGLDVIRLWNSRKSESSIRTDMVKLLTNASPNLLYQFNLDETEGADIYGVRSANLGGNPKFGVIVNESAGGEIPTTTDRPFLGDGLLDTTAPSVPAMQAHTEIGPTGFRIKWNASTDNVAVQNYIVDVATDSAFNNPVQGWSTRDVGRSLETVFENGAPNTAYYARVRAVDTAGNASAWSSYASNAPIITTSTADYTAPSIPPQNLRVTSTTSTSFGIEWDRGATIDEVAGYKVIVSLTPTFTNLVPTYRNLDVGLNTSKVFDTDILPLTAYWVKVRSYDQNANESWDSPILQVVTRAVPDTEPPVEVDMDTPTSVEATRFTLRWFPTTDNVGVEGYIVDVAQDAEMTQPVEGYKALDVGNVLRFNVYGVRETTTYFATIRAYDQAGNISPFNSVSQAITTAPLTSSADGVIEVGTNAYTFKQGTTDYNSENRVDTLNVNPSTVLKMTYAPVTALGIPTNLESFVWIETLSGAGKLEMYNGPTKLGEVTPTEGQRWVAFQLSPPPTNLLSGTLLELRATGTLSVTVGTGLTNINPSPTLSFYLDTEQVIRPVESDINVMYQAARNFIPAPDFLHETKSTFGHEATLGITEELTTDANWGVKVRKSTMTNGGSIKYFSDFNTDSTNKVDDSKMLRGSCYIGLVSNGGTKTPYNFNLRVGVEYTDLTTAHAQQTIEVVDGMHAYFVNGLTINPAKVVNRVYLEILSSGAFNGSIISYMPTVYQADEQLHPFSGNTYSGKWEEEANFGTSYMTYPKISGDLYYIGDSNDNGTARLALLSREVGLTTSSWFGTGIATKNATEKFFSAEAKTQFVINQLGNGSFDIQEDTNWFPILLGTGHEVDLTFGGMNLDGIASRSGFRHLNVNLKNKDTGSSDMVFGVANSTVLAKHAINGSTIRAYLKAKVGAEVSVSFSDSGTSAVTTLHTHTFAGDDWEQVEFDVPLGTVTGSGYIRFLANTADFDSGEQFSVDGVQVGASIPFFTDETFKGSYSVGGFGTSPVVGFLPYQGSQDVVWLVDDPDGVDSTSRMGMTGVLTDTVSISGAPDNILTVQNLKADVTSNTMLVTFSYEGDDGQTAELDIKWRRTDFTEEHAWNRVPVSWNRAAKKATALITGLNPRTSYTVEALASDKLLPVYGENPIQRTFVTETTSKKGISTPRILFGGYVLQDEATRGVWVESHNAFNHPERNLKIDKLPRYQGSVEISDWWEKKTISMSGGISANSRQELAELVDDLTLAFSRGQQNLVIDTLDERSFYYTATCTKFEMPEVAGENFRHLKWQAEFTCADPFRYDSKESIEENITLQNGETFNVTNTGDLMLSPQFHVTTTSPTNVEFTLINTSTGQRITPVTKIKMGDTLQILSDQLKVVKNGVNTDFSGSFPHLGVGDNQISVEVFPISYPVVLTIKRRHKYF